MTRITPWRWDARAAFPILVFCSLFFFQCHSTGVPSTSPDLVVSPSTGIQGNPLILSITAEDIAFDACDTFSTASLEFDYLFTEDPSLITVESVDLVNANTVRASIEIDDDSALGLYKLQLRCNETTTYSSGNRGFEVIGRQDENTLRITPAAGGAGARQLAVTLEVSPPFSYTNASYVQFGDGTDIIVSKRRIDSPQVMTVWIDISALTPQVEQQVVVGTGPDSVYGVFNVTERVEIAIESVVPDSVTKPGNDQDTPLEYWLIITGTTDDVGFIQPGMDGGVDDGEGSRVSFHPAQALSETDVELAGIETTEIQVDSLNVLRAKIAVFKHAPAGRMLVRVTTEERKVEKSFWLDVDANDPHLRVIYPRWAIERGGSRIDVVVEGVNFDVSDFQSVFFMEVDCTVQCDPLLVSDKLYLKVDVDEDYAATSTTLEVTYSGSQTAAAVLLIRDEDDPKAVFELGDEFPQGTNIDAKLILKGGGEIDSAATAYTPMRSGIRASKEFVTPPGELFVRLDVEQDAPLGTAWIRTLHDGVELETPVTVGSSSPPGSWISIFPDTFLQGRNQTVVDVQAHGFTFDPSSTTFQFDDPAIRIEEVFFVGGLAQLTVGVSPTARTSYPSNLYTRRNTGGEQAARACRVLGTPKARPVAVQPMEITRQPGGSQQTVDVRVEGIAFEDFTEAFVLDDIGVDVSLVQVTSENSHRLDFVLTVGESGPGGWIGIHIYSGWQSLVVPIHILSGDDESLTMQLTPGKVSPGATAVEVMATSPVADAFQDGTTEVFAAASGAYTTLLEITAAADEARFYLDTSVNVNMGSYGDKIPISLTTRKGAVVGFIEVEELNRYQVSESEPWQETMEDGEFSVVTADVTPVPSLVYGSVNWPGYADVSLDLRAENGLDVEGRTDTGSLWIRDPATTDMIVTPQSDPGGQPSEIRVKQVGVNAVPNTGSEWIFEEHLCDSPFLGSGAINGDIAEGRVPLVNDPPSSCRLVAVPIARVLGDRPWSTPDLWLELRDDDDTVLGSRVKGWPTQTDGDPRLYFDAQDGYLAIGSELGTAGDYLIHVRRTTVINEISRDGLEPFIEIVAEPGEVLNSPLSVALYDVDGLLLDAYVFANHTVDADGLVVIGNIAGADITDDIASSIPLDAPFALLVEDTEVIDCVQVGTVDGTDCSEGEPIPNDDPMPVFIRVESIDTNDNLNDFMSTRAATPGS